MGREGRRSKQLLRDPKEREDNEIRKERTISHSLENWLWKRLWIFRKTDYTIME
jgi:hypothetical protein